MLYRRAPVDRLRQPAPPILERPPRCSNSFLCIYSTPLGILSGKDVIFKNNVDGIKVGGEFLLKVENKVFRAL